MDVGNALRRMKRLPPAKPCCRFKAKQGGCCLLGQSMKLLQVPGLCRSGLVREAPVQPPQNLTYCRRLLLAGLLWEGL